VHRFAPCALLVVLCGCSEFASPAELDRPQILAIRSEPASVGLGESAELSILVADQDGPVEDLQPSWEIVDQAGAPALGSLEIAGDGVRYQAPGEASPFPTATTIQATVEVDGTVLTGLKLMVIGGPALENPRINELLVDGTAAGDELVVSAGQELTLDLEIDPPADDETTYSWYARPGTIEEYRSIPTVFQAPDEGEQQGWLFAVVRQGGGIDTFSIPLRVVP
jgi:hypothetical protein